MLVVPVEFILPGEVVYRATIIEDVELGEETIELPLVRCKRVLNRNSTDQRGGGVVMSTAQAASCTR